MTDKSNSRVPEWDAHDQREYEAQMAAEEARLAPTTGATPEHQHKWILPDGIGCVCDDGTCNERLSQDDTETLLAKTTADVQRQLNTMWELVREAQRYALVAFGVAMADGDLAERDRAEDWLRRAREATK